MKRLNKKGFTLVEILAVIAILAILMLLVMPNILDMFTDGKESAFITNTQSIYKAANTKFVSESLKTPGAFLFTNVDDLEVSGYTSKDLDLTSNSAKYCVFMDATGKITKIVVNDESYYLNVANTDGISIDALSAKQADSDDYAELETKTEANVAGSTTCTAPTASN